jgi:hypothetical protein
MKIVKWISLYLTRILIVLLLLISAISIYVAVLFSSTKNHILLPPFSYVDMSEIGLEYITIEGTLVSVEGGEIGSPLNTNEFTCFRSQGECTLVQAELFDDDYLTVYKEDFDTHSWDDNFIVFKGKENATACAEWTYRIDRIKKQLIGVREKATNYDSEICMEIGMDRFEVTLVDGIDAIEKLRGK